jgi:hypothetical protein
METARARTILRFYCTDLDTQLSTVAAYRSRYFTKPVVSTTLQVSRLVRPQWLLEIEAAVALPELRPWPKLLPGISCPEYWD